MTHATSLHDALSAIHFNNNGTTLSTDRFHWETIRPVGDSQKLFYLEAENVSCTGCVWSDGGKYFVPHPYLFKDVRPGPPAPPLTWHELSALDWNDPNAVVKQGGSNLQPSEDACKASCEAMPACSVGLWLNGTIRHGECWLASERAAEARTDFCGAAPGQSCIAFEREGAPTPGVYDVDAPASGVRSAVPLGGLGTGSVELRGDGSLHEWTIHNAGPNGAAKIQSYPAAAFGLAVNGGAPRLLQTHPHLSSPAGVAALRYSGAHPVSRLEVLDQSATGTLSASLLAFSTLRMADLRASARPAAAFVLDATQRAGGNAPANASFSLLLPLLVEEDQDRSGGTPFGAPLPATTAAACRRRCASATGCSSWVWTTAGSTCALQQGGVPLNRYRAGVTSGVAGSWVADADAQCLNLVRPGGGADAWQRLTLRVFWQLRRCSLLGSCHERRCGRARVARRCAWRGRAARWCVRCSLGGGSGAGWRCGHAATHAWLVLSGARSLQLRRGTPGGVCSLRQHVRAPLRLRTRGRLG